LGAGTVAQARSPLTNRHVQTFLSTPLPRVSLPRDVQLHQKHTPLPLVLVAEVRIHTCNFEVDHLAAISGCLMWKCCMRTVWHINLCARECTGQALELVVSAVELAHELPLDVAALGKVADHQDVRCVEVNQCPPRTQRKLGPKRFLPEASIRPAIETEAPPPRLDWRPPNQPRLPMRIAPVLGSLIPEATGRTARNCV